MFDKRSLRELLNNGAELNTDQSRRFRNLWKETPASQRVEIIGSTIDEVTKFIVQERALEGEELRLSKLLSLNISHSETMELHLTNYLSYIAHLVREYRLNARNLLNMITDFIRKTENQLHKEIEEQVKVYRSLEDDEDSEIEAQTKDVKVRDKYLQQAERKLKQDEITRVQGNTASFRYNQEKKQNKTSIGHRTARR